MRGIICLGIMALAFAGRAQDVDQVVAKYISFTGGEKHWKKVTTIVTTGEYDYGGIKFPFTTFSKAPDKYKILVPFEGKYYAQAFDGARGWKIDAFKNETKATWLSGPAAKAMANESDVELENVWINYKTKGHKAAYIGTDSVGTSACHHITLTRATGETEEYYFDTKTYALLKKIAASKNAEMQGAILNTLYSDYRSVGDLNIPFKVASDANGQAILTVTVADVKTNVPVDDKEFQP